MGQNAATLKLLPKELEAQIVAKPELRSYDQRLSWIKAQFLLGRQARLKVHTFSDHVCLIAVLLQRYDANMKNNMVVAVIVYTL